MISDDAANSARVYLVVDSINAYLRLHTSVVIVTVEKQCLLGAERLIFFTTRTRSSISHPKHDFEQACLPNPTNIYMAYNINSIETTILHTSSWSLEGRNP